VARSPGLRAASTMTAFRPLIRLDHIFICAVKCWTHSLPLRPGSRGSGPTFHSFGSNGLPVSETVTDKSVKGGQFEQAHCVLIIFYGQTDVDIELPKLPWDFWAYVKTRRENHWIRQKSALPTLPRKTGGNWKISFLAQHHWVSHDKPLKQALSP